MIRRLRRISRGRLTIVDSHGAVQVGDARAGGIAGTVQVQDPRFYRHTALGGGLGAAEAYLRGYWDSPDLLSAMRVLAQNAEALAGVERGAPRVLAPARVAINRLRRNNRSGSRRNIAAHYDLSNEFFALMLDSTMTYSCGVFPSPHATLEEASVEKYDRVCRKLALSPRDHVVEIGAGWGGFAVHAVQRYGCRVTTTTISRRQHAFAQRRITQAGLNDRVTLLKSDYRDLRGAYDKLVSIEMIEAVGQQYLRGYFAKCSRLLKPDGMMLLQAITIPDHRYDAYRHSVDFIRRYVFPGGFLPSVRAIAECLGRATDFRFFHAEDFGPHYARTLAAWRERFKANISQVQSLGFDQRFERLWEYYLCYCQAGFLERQIGVSQILLTKPQCRRAPLLE